MVLEQGTARTGRSLCLGGIRLSLPPQCGDVPIASWDWETVEGEESAAGTTLGCLPRRRDATTAGLFTVTEVGPVRGRGRAFGTGVRLRDRPARSPEGGWVVPEPERDTQNQAGRGAGTQGRNRTT